MDKPVTTSTSPATLMPDGFFDAAWYASKYDGIVGSGDPLWHFLVHGWREGLSPNRYFDAGWYASRNSDIALAGADPLLHYLQYGEAEDRAPSADFDTAWYRARHALGADASPLAHYLGRRQRPAGYLGEPFDNRPNAAFDPEWYAATYRLLLGKEADPIWHYRNTGMRMGCDASAEAAVIRVSGLFDAAYYRATYYPAPSSHAETISADDEEFDDPIYDFCREGWRIQHRRPNRAFDTAWYLERNDDVASTGMNPLLHYLCYGEAENRQPFEGFHPARYRERNTLAPGELCLGHHLRVSGAAGRIPDGDLRRPRSRNTGARNAVAAIRASGLFDLNFYLANYPDVRESPLEPLEHFSQYGWQEGRRPNPYFDTAWYVRTYLEGAADINPLLHYIRIGEQRGHRPIVYFDSAWYGSIYQPGPDASPLRHYLAGRRTQAFSPIMLFDVAGYVAKYGGSIGRNRDPFSHYLRVGISRDVDPGPGFDATRYRLQGMSQEMTQGSSRYRAEPGEEVHERLRREALNPLVHFLLKSFARPVAPQGTGEGLERPEPAA